jgi:hypothetical protein
MPKKPVLSLAEGPVLSLAEGPVLSLAEGPVLSLAEGPVLSLAEGITKISYPAIVSFLRLIHVLITPSYRTEAVATQWRRFEQAIERSITSCN